MADGMDTIEGRYPSLRALHVFDAVMRYKGLRAAAEKLFITPQAVSQQIKSLENQLQVQLFRRSGRNIIPTEDAVILARYIENGFQDFLDGIKTISEGKRINRINVNATPYFAANYLIPRLQEFRRLRSTCDIRLKTNVELPDFHKDDIDVAILWGFGQWSDCEVKFLFHDFKILCCAPSLTKGHLAIREPNDITKHTLLLPIRSVALWRNVLTFLGATRLEAKSTIEMYDNESMRRATIEGLGVGLISERDALREIQLGTLVAPFGVDICRRMPQEHSPAFYLVYPRSHKHLPSVVEFCRWIEQSDWTLV